MGQIDTPKYDFCDQKKKDIQAVFAIFLSYNQQVREEVGALLYDLDLLRGLGNLSKEVEAKYERRLILLFSKINYNLRLLEQAEKYGRGYCIDREGDIRYLIPPVSQRL